MRTQGEIKDTNPNPLWTDETGEDEQTATTISTDQKHIISIQSDPDYLYRLLRLQESTQFFQAIEHYFQETNCLPFDAIGRVHLFDLSPDKSKIPILSLLEAAYTLNTTNHSIVPSFIGKYFVEMSTQLFSFLLPRPYLLRIFVTNYPSCFNSFIFTSPQQPKPIQLCDCLTTIIKSGKKLSNDETICFCHAQDQLNWDHDTLSTTLETSLQQLGCHPCDINTKMPTSVEFTHQSTQKYIVSIKYAYELSLFDTLISLSKYSLAQTLLTTVLQHSATNQAFSTYSDWNDDVQYNLYLAHITTVSKSIAANIQPEQFANILFCLQSTFTNWHSLFCDALQHRSELHATDSSFNLTTTQTSVTLAFEKLLFSYIQFASRRFAFNQQQKSPQISTAIFDMLCHLLKPQTSATISNYLLKHIFLFYTPYLCPFHISIIQYVLPMWLLQNLHPGTFCHFNNNHKEFTFPTNQTTTTPALTSIYTRIRVLRNERSSDSASFPLSKLLLHPFALLSTYLSPFQYNPDAPLTFPQPATKNTTATRRNFNPAPTFIQQLYKTINTHQNISLFIDRHFPLLTFGNNEQNIDPLAQLTIYFKPTIISIDSLKPIFDGDSKQQLFINGLFELFNIQSFSGPTLSCFTIDPTSITSPSNIIVQHHNKEYFQSFHTPEQEECLMWARSVLQLNERLTSPCPNSNLFKLCGHLNQQQFIDMVATLDKINAAFTSSQTNETWDRDHPLYDELLNHFSRDDDEIVDIFCIQFWNPMIQKLSMR